MVGEALTCLESFKFLARRCQLKSAGIFLISL